MSSPVTPVVDLRPDRSRTYHKPRPILDRILVRRIESQTETTNFAIPDKYREKSRLGEVIAVGDYVVLGGEKCPVSDFVRVGDRCIYGEYTAESYDSTDPTQATLFLVRLQDIRTVERLVRE
jgi:co-chaperonin GroES (HSP10)